jgi:uncharacterized protein (DUF1697 family)
VCAAVEKRIAERHKLKVPVVLRSADELEEAARGNPYLERGQDKALHVMFLSEEPPRASLSKLDPARSPGDEFRVVGRDVFLFLPNGVARTKLTNDYFDRSLGVVSTVRNWRTLMTLLEMTRS